MFAQFGSDLDKSTRDKLVQGERLVETLIQPQYATMPVEEQIIVLYSATNRVLNDIPTSRVKDFNKGLLEFIKNRYPGIISAIVETGELKPENEELLINGIDEYKTEYLKLNKV